MSKNQPQLISEEFYLTPICEAINGQKQWYLKGIYAQADVINKNGRIYSEAVLDNAINGFINEYMNNNRGVGELNHPPRIAVDPDRICHRVLSLEKSGKNWNGNSVVLNTTCGKNVQALLEGNIRIGVSTRGFGTMEDNSAGVKVVQDDFKIVAIDAVFHPSNAPLVTAILEGQDLSLITEDVESVNFIQSIREDVLKANANMVNEQQLAAFEKFIKYISRT